MTRALLLTLYGLLIARCVLDVRRLARVERYH